MGRSMATPFSSWIPRCRVLDSPSQERNGRTDGWHTIDQLGAWECYLSKFTTVEDVPAKHKNMWTRAWATVLERMAAAESELERDRALKLFCILAQVLLRTPRRGGRMGAGTIQARFAALARGDWGRLITMWQSDVVRSTEREERRDRQQRRMTTRQQGKEEEEERVRNKALHLIGTFEVEKAVSLMDSNQSCSKGGVRHIKSGISDLL